MLYKAYLRSGRTLEELLSLSTLECSFLLACEEKAIEEENDKMRLFSKLPSCPFLKSK